MNLVGYQPIHESLLKPGATYYLRTKFGQGFVLTSEDGLNGWTVELQPNSSFQSPLLKKLKSGDIMTVPPGTGKWYEAKV
jgi:hypothetical protein